MLNNIKCGTWLWWTSPNSFKSLGIFFFSKTNQTIGLISAKHINYIENIVLYLITSKYFKCTFWNKCAKIFLHQNNLNYGIQIPQDQDDYASYLYLRVITILFLLELVTGVRFQFIHPRLGQAEAIGALVQVKRPHCTFLLLMGKMLQVKKIM